MTNIKFRMIG